MARAQPFLRFFVRRRLVISPIYDNLKPLAYTPVEWFYKLKDTAYAVCTRCQKELFGCSAAATGMCLLKPVCQKPK